MSEKNDGGPAFPTHGLNVPLDEFDDPKHLGMSLRDWFAGQAISGLIFSGPVAAGQNDLLNWAEGAYKMADAMLEAREQ